ncbi:MAG: C2H2-type zinc finger protein [Candidatus Caldarchaeales archaeon]
MRDVVHVVVEGFRGLEVPLAARLTERLVEWGAIAVPKEGSIAIDLSVSWSRPSGAALLGVLREALTELGVSEHCRAEADGERLRVVVLDPEEVRIALGAGGSAHSGLHVCPHCGYATPYEELMREHVKLHYVGL